MCQDLTSTLNFLNIEVDSKAYTSYKYSYEYMIDRLLIDNLNVKTAIK